MISLLWPKITRRFVPRKQWPTFICYYDYFSVFVVVSVCLLSLSPPLLLDPNRYPLNLTLFNILHEKSKTKVRCSCCLCHVYHVWRDQLEQITVRKSCCKIRAIEFSSYQNYVFLIYFAIPKNFNICYIAAVNLKIEKITSKYIDRFHYISIFTQTLFMSFLLERYSYRTSSYECYIKLNKIETIKQSPDICLLVCASEIL